MSHMAKNKVEGIDQSKVNPTLLREAVELLRREGVIDIEYVKSIKDWYGTEQAVKGLGIKLRKEDRFGMDLYMENGTLYIQTDDMNSERMKSSHFMKELTKAYTVVAIKHTLHSEGLFGRLSTKLHGTEGDRRAEYNLIAEGY